MNLIERIKYQSEINPNKVALVLENKKLTYKQIDHYSDVFSEFLKANGVSITDRIGICLPSSFELIISIISIIKAGGCYVPLDFTYPNKRLNYIVNDAQLKLLVSSQRIIEEKAFKEDVPNNNILEISENFIYNLDLKIAGTNYIRKDSPTYILYTSGTTGKPKGVVMSHNPLRKLIEWQIQNSFTKQQTTLQFSPIGFDVSFQEIFSTLCDGGTLVLIKNDVRKDPKLLLDEIIKNEVQRVFVPYVALNQIVNTTIELGLFPKTLKEIITAGEQLKITESVKEFFKNLNGCRLINQYGPTETHVATAYSLDTNYDKWAKFPPIGSPLDHVKIKVVDSKLNSSNEGELLLGGDCLSLGYVKNGVVSDEHLVQISNENYYKTGDIVRINNLGLLEFIGRNDKQVKIRGYRIELYEIEKVIEDISFIKDCIINVSGIDETKRLIAYITTNTYLNNKEMSLLETNKKLSQDITSIIKDKLPEYMIPFVYILLDNIPLTPSGKVNKLELPELSLFYRPSLITKYIKASTLTEKVLENIWIETLNLNKVGIDDVFFEIGGHSLLLTIIRKKIADHFRIHLDLAALLENPTIRELAKHIDSSYKNPKPSSSQKKNNNRSSSVAIIGLACRFPEAVTPDEFWQNLKDGKESIQKNENEKEEDSSHNINEKYIWSRATVPDVEMLDADFWGYTSREAKLQDPQYRLFLECVWEAIEDAGYSIDNIGKKVGVFGGSGPNGYLVNNILPFKKDFHFLEKMEDLQLSIATSGEYMTTKVSHKMGFKGPSINIQTACSTSLVALHMACKSIISGECDYSLVGASSIILPQKSGYLYQPDMVFSSDGHCRSYDSTATGTVFGDGCGVVLLKNYENAVKDNDPIYATIKGSAINNDGADKIGFHGSSINSQKEVINNALNDANVSIDSISYLEGHGTGTILGDMIELEALNGLFNTSRLNKLTLGSVKPNIGHLGWASGIAGLIKVVLALKNKEIPPTLHFNDFTNDFKVKNTSLEVNTSLVSWQPIKNIRRAGISSFGLGGTNSHVILEEATTKSLQENKYERSFNVLTLSAKTDNALKQLTEKYIFYIKANKNINFKNLSFTANTGRKHFNERLAIVFKDKDELTSKLNFLKFQKFDFSRYALSSCNSSLTNPLADNITFVFSGLGTQYLNMASCLYSSNSVFAKSMDECNEITKSIYNISVLDIIYDKNNQGIDIDKIHNTHPILFSIGYSLAKVWISLGIVPNQVMGHSFGEYIAACIAGVFDLKTALSIVCYRGKLMDRLPKDTQMLAVRCSIDQIKRLLKDIVDYSIAVENTPELIVISAKRTIISKIIEVFNSNEIDTKILNIPIGGHSSDTEIILDDFRVYLDKFNFQKPSIDIISNLTGKIETEMFQTAEYWVKHTRNIVNFRKGIQSLEKNENNTIIEISSRPDLLGMILENLPKKNNLLLPTLRQGKNDWEQLLTSLSLLYVNGFDIDWNLIESDYNRSKIHLPTYPFQHKKYWIDAPSVKGNSEVPLVDSSSILKDFYTIDWKLEDVDSELKPESQKKFLIFGYQNDSLTQSIVSTLNINKYNTNLVFPDFDIDTSSKDLYSLNNSLESYVSILRSLQYDAVIFLWSSKYISKLFKDIQEYSVFLCSSIAYLVQASVELNITNLHIYFVTNNTQSVTGKDVLDSGSSVLWGLSRTLSIEYPNYKSVRIDIEENNKNDDEFLKKFIAEIIQVPKEYSIAFRNNKRYIARLKNKRDSSSSDISFNNDGTFIITGGMGGIGKEICKWLVEKGATHIILLGRKSINKIKEEHFGNNVLVEYKTCDISNQLEIQSLFDELKKSKKNLVGVFHTAGVLDDASFLNITSINFETVFTPKVRGTQNLHRITKDLFPNLQLFVLFSSATSLIGNAGQANHAAANAYMDSLASHRNQNGYSCTSINWGTWTETGRIMDNKKILQHINSLGFLPVINKTGLKALSSICSNKYSQVGFIPLDFEKFLPSTNQISDPFFNNFKVNYIDSVARHDSFIMKLSNSDFIQKKKMLKEYIVGILTNYLDISFFNNQLDIDKELLIEFGLDSLSAIEIRNKFQYDLGINLPPTFLFKYSNLDKIIEYLSNINFEISSSSNNESIQNEISYNNDSMERLLSMQQKRWLSLIGKSYGKRIVPIVFFRTLNNSHFKNSILYLLNRHELLRYTYPNTKRIKIEEVNNSLPVDEELFIDLSNVNNDRKKLEIKNLFEDLTQQIKSPSESLSWQIRCINIDSSKFAIVIYLQHIDFDGRSLSVFCKEFLNSYDSFLSRENPNLPQTLQYYKFSEWQNNYIKNKIFEDRAFFTGLFLTLDETTVLPHHPGFTKTTPLESVRYTPLCKTGLWRNIQDISFELKVSPFSIIFACYALMVSEIVEKDDIVISIINSGRSKAEFKDTIGPFTAPFPIRVNPKVNLDRLILHCNNLILHVNSRSYYPVTDLIENINAFNSLPVDTYFSDIGINLTNYDSQKDNANNDFKLIEILGKVTEEPFTQINTSELKRIPGLHLVINIKENEIYFNFWYHSSRFSAIEVKKWACILTDKIESTISRFKNVK